MSIQELEDFFNNQELPSQISTHPAIRIVDVPKFLETQFIQIKAQGIKTPAYDRLIALRQWFIEREGSTDSAEPSI